MQKPYLAVHFLEELWLSEFLVRQPATLHLHTMQGVLAQALGPCNRDVVPLIYDMVLREKRLHMADSLVRPRYILVWWLVQLAEEALRGERLVRTADGVWAYEDRNSIDELLNNRRRILYRHRLMQRGACRCIPVALLLCAVGVCICILSINLTPTPLVVIGFVFGVLVQFVMCILIVELWRLATTEL